MLAVNSVSLGYRVGEHYPGVYLSNIELQIVIGLLRNRTPERISYDLEISSRTFQYYCCKLLKLMGYFEMADLLDALRDSELYQYINV